MRVNASWGVDGLTTRSPAAWAKYASGESEWCSAAPMPPANGTRIVIGMRTAPAVR